MLPKGSRLAICVKGLHEMTEDNLYIRPGDGALYCKACRKETNRIRRGILRLQFEDQKREDNPDYVSHSDILRHNRAERVEFEEQAFEEGYTAMKNGVTRHQFASSHKKYSTLWYRQRERWLAGWDEAHKTLKALVDSGAIPMPSESSLKDSEDDTDRIIAAMHPTTKQDHTDESF